MTIINIEIKGVEILVYSGIFFSLYFAIFVLAAFFENRNRVYKKRKNKNFPGVSLIVPCYNEEKNIAKTLSSLINLCYPREKLEIIVVDDGSQDNTFQKANSFAAKDQRIKVIRKENGGKYTALNCGLRKAGFSFIGTVDADSYLHPQALKKIMRYFHNPRVMAVIATVKTAKPRNILEGVQCVEYLMGAFLRKVFSWLDSVNVVPGPLSVFRKNVFETLGPFRKGHQTEDLELAFRMQKANYKIVHAIESIVYTKACPTFGSLFSQRLRWKRGFLLNLKDYPELLNFKKHGNLAFLLVYSLLGSLISIFLALYSGWWVVDAAWGKISNLALVGFDIFANISNWKPGWFLVNIKPTFALGIISLATLLIYLFFSKRLTFDKGPLKRNVVFYILLYAFLNAIWWISAIFSICLKKEAVWE